VRAGQWPRAMVPQVAGKNGRLDRNRRDWQRISKTCKRNRLPRDRMAVPLEG
jgi:hypothetical protein